MIFTMKNKILSTAYRAFPILFWILIWQFLAEIVNNSFFFPSFFETLRELFTLFSKEKIASTITTIFATFARVIAGFFIGSLSGVVLAVISHHYHIFNDFISPIISVIKATPVASFIILLWISLDGNALTIFIAFLMVLPIVWQNLMDGYNSINKDLSEVCDVFNFSFRKRMKILIFPALSKYLGPALITSAGLAWKSEIAAEIIAYTKKSIGQYINDAKFAYDTPKVFAWTLLVIIFSISLEKLTKVLLKRYKV